MPKNPLLFSTVKEYQLACAIEYIRNGYYVMWSESGKIGDIAELGLIITEVSEAMELIRLKPSERKTEKTIKKMLALEGADIIIRTINFMTRKGINVHHALDRAIKKNMKRGYKHGKAV